MNSRMRTPGPQRRTTNILGDLTLVLPGQTWSHRSWRKTWSTSSEGIRSCQHPLEGISGPLGSLWKGASIDIFDVCWWGERRNRGDYGSVNHRSSSDLQRRCDILLARRLYSLVDRGRLLGKPFTFLMIESTPRHCKETSQNCYRREE